MTILPAFSLIEMLLSSGLKCSDPGQPLLGRQVSSDYRQGQLVTFGCDKNGFELSNKFPISCMVKNGNAEFNGSVPQCIGK